MFSHMIDHVDANLANHTLEDAITKVPSFSWTRFHVNARVGEIYTRSMALIIG